MKVIFNDDNFILFIIKKYEETTIKKFLKDTLIKIKKRYNKKISGFYNVTLYFNDKLGMILEFEKEDSFDFLSDIIDLNITVSDNENIFLEFEDPCFIDKNIKVYNYKNRYYINLDEITQRKYYKFLEFSEIKYGDEVNKIMNNMRKIKM